MCVCNVCTHLSLQVCVLLFAQSTCMSAYLVTRTCFLSTSSGLPSHPPGVWWNIHLKDKPDHLTLWLNPPPLHSFYIIRFGYCNKRNPCSQWAARMDVRNLSGPSWAETQTLASRGTNARRTPEQPLSQTPLPAAGPPLHPTSQGHSSLHRHLHPLFQSRGSREAWDWWAWVT